jgi:hypothetical protein
MATASVGSVLVSIFAVIAVIVIATGGGFLFRLAQGWGHVPDFFGPSSLFAQSSSRFIFAAVMGVAVIGTLRRLHALPVALLVACMWFFLLFVNWGTVSDPITGMQTEPGVFDVLIGRQFSGWPMWRAWLREYTNFCLRGLLQV